MFVTHHAAKQFAARIWPGMSREGARAYLFGAVRGATPTGDRTENGESIWRIQNPDALLVVKVDPRHGHVVVTVLAPDMPQARAEVLAEAEEEVVAAAARAGARTSVGEERYPRPRGRKNRRRS